MSGQPCINVHEIDVYCLVNHVHILLPMHSSPPSLHHYHLMPTQAPHLSIALSHNGNQAFPTSNFAKLICYHLRKILLIKPMISVLMIEMLILCVCI